MEDIFLKLGIVFFALACEYMDSTLGMGYGTTLAPVLLLMGYSPGEIVPAVLVSELVSGIFAAGMHHRSGNVDFKPCTTDLSKIIAIFRANGYRKGVQKTLPKHLKVAIFLSFCGVIGSFSAVFIAVSVPEMYLRLYISLLVICMGVIIALFRNKSFTFSWPRITALGLLASFNKGISGGGYGPLVTGGQILSGLDSKSAVGITSLSESMTCLAGVIGYLWIQKHTFSFEPTLYIVAGAMLSVPLSAMSVKHIDASKLKLWIAMVTILLGSVTLYNIFF